MRYEYSVGGEKVVLESDDDVVGVRFRDNMPRSMRATVAAQSGADFTQRLEVEDEPFTVVRIEPRDMLRPQRVAAAVTALDAKDEVTRVAPVFRLADGYAIATERVLLRLRNDADDGAWLVDDPARRVARVSSGGAELVLTLAPAEDPLAVAAALAADHRVRWAEPDFVNIRSKLYAPRAMPGTPAGTDPLVEKQYALRLLKADEAWKIQGGSPSVLIAVLDEGIDTRHEDLRDAVTGSYDALDDDDFQEPNPWDGHGTACAGLAVATGGNGRGVRGIAPGCRALAVRIAQSLAPNGPWQTTNLQIGRGIERAWQRGAWVLSNSWGGGAPSNLIAQKIQDARTLGRQGRGAVVVVAAGNENGAVSFPATLPGVVAVAASNEFDEPKTRHSRDGESWWGSCFGPEVWVAAPGVHNYTTDITGAAGYNAGGALDASYIADFNGTSSSTPLVAGVAALVLSVAPDLTEQEVRDILKITADKVGGVPYTEGRNDRMGHGRVNALRAVEEAKRRRDRDCP